MPWKSKNTSNFGEDWNYEKAGDAIEGVLKDTKLDVGKYHQTVYIFEKEDGSLVNVWGSTTIDKGMLEVSMGEKVRIEYQGEKDIGRGQPLKLFDVAVWSSE